jgi:hypothetical protein
VAFFRQFSQRSYLSLRGVAVDGPGIASGISAMTHIHRSFAIV